MTKKLLTIVALSLVAAVSFGLSAVYASEVTGTLSSSSVSTTGTSNTTSGSVSGSVTGGTVIAGNVGGGNSNSRSSGSSGSSGNSNPQVLGLSTDVPSGSYPGFPNTGRAAQ